MPATTAKGSAGARERIERLCAAGLPAQELIEAVSRQLERVVPVDALFMCATDPDTMLGLGAGVVRDMPDETCQPFWTYEFEVPDFNKFTDLARGPRHVGDLHTATGGRPQRSARWRELNQLMGADAELRAAFNAGGRAWGVLHASRVSAHDRFSEAEVGFVEAIAPLVARGLRGSLVAHPAEGKAGRGPGMAILDARTRLVSATPEALAWMDEVRSIRRLADPGGVELPSEVAVAVHEARARAALGEDAVATRARARTTTGGWLLIHASCLRDATGEPGHTAVVIEPAKASDVAPLIVEAYELTPRELDVTRALARGLTTNEIAGELHLSRYTVQDHLKSVYEKVGVGSRGELVAKMFADHYHERLDRALHPPARPAASLA